MTLAQREAFFFFPFETFDHCHVMTTAADVAQSKTGEKSEPRPRLRGGTVE